jgi:hypothetical protein
LSQRVVRTKSDKRGGGAGGERATSVASGVTVNNYSAHFCSDLCCVYLESGHDDGEVPAAGTSPASSTQYERRTVYIRIQVDDCTSNSRRARSHVTVIDWSNVDAMNMGVTLSLPSEIRPVAQMVMLRRT